MLDDLAECAHYAFVAFSDERRQDVLADPVAPKVVAAVASRVVRSIEINPVFLGSAGKVVAAATDAATLEIQTAFEANDVESADLTKFSI